MLKTVASSLLYDLMLSIITGSFLLIFSLVIIFLEKHIDKESHKMSEIFFLAIVYVVYLFLFPILNWRVLILFCFGLLLTMHAIRNISISLGLSIATGLFGLLVAYIGRPIFLQIEQRGETFLKSLVFPVTIPAFYIIMPLEAISSSLFSWLFTTYTWEAVNMIRGKSITQKNRFRFNLKSVVRYLQVIPIGLLPLIMPHIFFNYALLDGISDFLASLCLSKIYFILFSLLIVFARKRIFENPFLRVTSVFTLLSLVSTFYSLFAYIALNVPSGVLIISLCLSSLLGASLGFSIADSIINDALK